jgi:TM2 domain-containing membrane protein YozV
MSTRASPQIAAALSFVVPGLGQIYAGRVLWGIVWLIVTPGFWIGSGGTLGWVCHIASAWQAWVFSRGER